MSNYVIGICGYYAFVIILKASALFLDSGLCFLPWKVSHKSQMHALTIMDTIASVMPFLLWWVVPSWTVDQSKPPYVFLSGISS